LSSLEKDIALYLRELGAASGISTQEGRSNRDRRILLTELKYLYFWLNIIRMMKLRKLREASHMSIMEDRRVVYRLQVGYLKERDQL
jgi:hypothetical protein